MLRRVFNKLPELKSCYSKGRGRAAALARPQAAGAGRRRVCVHARGTMGALSTATARNLTTRQVRQILHLARGHAPATTFDAMDLLAAPTAARVGAHPLSEEAEVDEAHALVGGMLVALALLVPVAVGTVLAGCSLDRHLL